MVKPGLVSLLTLPLLCACAVGGMTRESVNHVEWGMSYNLDQGELVGGVSRLLHLSGQTDLVVDPASPLGLSAGHPGDIRAQIEASLAHIDTLLEQAGMDRSNVLTLRFFTTDMNGFLENYDVYAKWIEPAGIRPPQSLLGINALVLPELLVEIEAVAAD